jgi:uncharacterized membrane protein
MWNPPRAGTGPAGIDVACCMAMTTSSATANGADRTVKRLFERVSGWHPHPGVRTGDQLSVGERAADKMRNGMGSWAFVFGALLFLALWMGLNRNSGFDKYPFILLNLVLSCLAAMQGAILLIAAKRSDQIAAELAQHDYNTDVEAKAIIENLSQSFAAMAAQHEELHRQVAALREQLTGGPGGVPHPTPPSD